MQKRWLAILSTLSVFYSVLWFGQAAAETRYVTDITYVPMRVGPGNEYRIIHRGIRTGTALELLEEDSGNGYTKVRNGETEGYIPSQYLMNNPPAFRQVPVLQEQNKTLTDKNRNLEQRLAESDNQLQEVSSELGKTENRLEQQQGEMKHLQEITADPLAIDRRNQQLVEENENLKNQVQLVEAENQQLMKDDSLRWYLFGGGTVLLGILLGLILPMLKRDKKQSSWV
ncbi:TIGR04211 family SH3 domain-containing protein [uncultured Endozoicomonas sp.]|uniref:TIGR04211 family SH3 domain-containing protein n=1 Tax=uncultured Endozoicomonas sp. TaxID=432652 RepID=UPI002636F325|nr:TIGR04211 family SH3 domain-containing protein [uncultured Endozoicomonas sp.]